MRSRRLVARRRRRTRRLLARALASRSSVGGPRRRQDAVRHTSAPAVATLGGAEVRAVGRASRTSSQMPPFPHRPLGPRRRSFTWRRQLAPHSHLGRPPPPPGRPSPLLARPSLFIVLERHNTVHLAVPPALLDLTSPPRVGAPSPLPWPAVRGLFSWTTQGRRLQSLPRLRLESTVVETLPPQRQHCSTLNCVFGTLLFLASRVIISREPSATVDALFAHQESHSSSHSHTRRAGLTALKRVSPFAAAKSESLPPPNWRYSSTPPPREAIPCRFWLKRIRPPRPASVRPWWPTCLITNLAAPAQRPTCTFKSLAKWHSRAAAAPPTAPLARPRRRQPLFRRR